MTPIITKYGLIQGVESEHAITYKGVPYARPPVGEYRFCHTQPPVSWEGVLVCDNYPSKCCQDDRKKGSFYQQEFESPDEYVPPSSEDCLYLNIWTPKEKGNCPVAIWYHGGGFMHGHCSEMTFTSEEYAKREIILVTVNYRLGIFGYFAHPELSKRDGYSGNYGLSDQIAAIDWVRENIEAFGGDPDKITIFGQSAGSLSVQAIVSSPVASGKIHRAIMQSGGGHGSSMAVFGDLASTEKVCAGYLKKNKLNLSDLYSMTYSELHSLGKKFFLYSFLRTGGMLPFSPIIDGHFLFDDMDKLVESGSVARIPYMIGSTKDDIMVSKAGKKNRDKNYMYKSAISWCEVLSSSGFDCYAYFFSHDLPGDKKGAFHSAELWYMFGTLNKCRRPLTEHDYTLSERMLDDWALFMNTGKPGFDSYPHVCEYR